MNENQNSDPSFKLTGEQRERLRQNVAANQFPRRMGRLAALRASQDERDASRARFEERQRQIQEQIHPDSTETE